MKTKFSLNFVSAFSQKIETLEIFIVLFFYQKSYSDHVHAILSVEKILFS